MITLEEAREQLLLKIKSAANCMNHPDNSGLSYISSPCDKKAHDILMKMYHDLASLPITNILFKWHRNNIGKVRISVIDGEGRI